MLKGEISFAKGFYHIRLKTAHPRLPSSEQVFVDLPPLQFAYSNEPGLATYFHFFFRFFKKGSCQLLAKVCARSTG